MGRSAWRFQHHLRHQIIRPFLAAYILINTLKERRSVALETEHETGTRRLQWYLFILWAFQQYHCWDHYPTRRIDKFSSFHPNFLSFILSPCPHLFGGGPLGEEPGWRDLPYAYAITLWPATGTLLLVSCGSSGICQTF